MYFFNTPEKYYILYKYAENSNGESAKGNVHVVKLLNLYFIKMMFYLQFLKTVIFQK